MNVLALGIMRIPQDSRYQSWLSIQQKDKKLTSAKSYVAGNKAPK